MDPRRRTLLAWLWRLPVLAALGGAGFALFEAGRVLFGKEQADQTPDFEPVEPVAVAPLSALQAPWDSVPFTLDGLPALALRLPEPIAGALSRDGAHFAGFSRVCTHQGCIVGLNRDLEAIALAFNFRSPTPALVCPCHLSVFAPLQGGEAVSGPAVRPLPRIALASEEGTLLAVGIERTPDTAGLRPAWAPRWPQG